LNPQQRHKTQAIKRQQKYGFKYSNTGQQILSVAPFPAPPEKKLSLSKTNGFFRQNYDIV